MSVGPVKRTTRKKLKQRGGSSASILINEIWNDANSKIIEGALKATKTKTAGITAKQTAGEKAFAHLKATKNITNRAKLYIALTDTSIILKELGTLDSDLLAELNTKLREKVDADAAAAAPGAAAATAAAVADETAATTAEAAATTAEAAATAAETAADAAAATARAAATAARATATTSRAAATTTAAANPAPAAAAAETAFATEYAKLKYEPVFQIFKKVIFENLSVDKAENLIKTAPTFSSNITDKNKKILDTLFNIKEEYLNLSTGLLQPAQRIYAKRFADVNFLNILSEIVNLHKEESTKKAPAVENKGAPAAKGAPAVENKGAPAENKGTAHANKTLSVPLPSTEQLAIELELTEITSESLAKAQEKLALKLSEVMKNKKRDKNAVRTLNQLLMTLQGLKISKNREKFYKELKEKLNEIALGSKAAGAAAGSAGAAAGSGSAAGSGANDKDIMIGPELSLSLSLSTDDRTSEEYKFHTLLSGKDYNKLLTNEAKAKYTPFASFNESKVALLGKFATDPSDTASTSITTYPEMGELSYNTEENKFYFQTIGKADKVEENALTNLVLPILQDLVKQKVVETCTVEATTFDKGDDILLLNNTKDKFKHYKIQNIYELENATKYVLTTDQLMQIAFVDKDALDTEVLRKGTFAVEYDVVFTGGTADDGKGGLITASQIKGKITTVNEGTPPTFEIEINDTTTGADPGAKTSIHTVEENKIEAKAIKYTSGTTTKYKISTREGKASAGGGKRKTKKRQTKKKGKRANKPKNKKSTRKSSTR